VAFLAFHANHADLAERMARADAEHATPVDPEAFDAKKATKEMRKARN
jgi:hypothetical protein